jgi:hypothetical protein
MQTPRNVLVIDLFGLSAEEVRERFPEVYQWVFERVRPERVQSPDRDLREKWWLFRRTNQVMRTAIAGLPRYIATVETAKHRTFQFLDASVLPDNMLIAIGLDDAFFLGVLSSSLHVSWALAAGGRLGVGNDPRYNKSRCFETFPVPTATQELQAHIRGLAEQLDAHRKRQQAQHPDLTLTGMYNVLEKLKRGEPLNAKERIIHEQGIVSVLKQLHDELDLAVLKVYGWSDLGPLMQVTNGNAAPGAGGTPQTREEVNRALDEALLQRLVALNGERAAEEKRELVHWLRPEFQHPAKGTSPAPTQIEIPSVESDVADVPRHEKLPWPKELPEQVRLVAQVLCMARKPLSIEALSERYTGKGPWKKRLPQLVETLVLLGRARRVGAGILGVD